MIDEDLVVYCKVEYVTADVDGNIVLGVSKKTSSKSITQLLKEYEGKEITIIIKPYYNKEETVNDGKSWYSYQ